MEINSRRKFLFNSLALTSMPFLNSDVYGIMAETAAKYSKENFVKATIETFENLLKNRIQKLEEIKETINE